jgi:hypothetical protein
MFVFLTPVFALAWPVPDTGQTASITDTFGEDSDSETITPSTPNDGEFLWTVSGAAIYLE